MKLYKTILAAAIAVVAATGLTSCESEYDYPPVISPELGGDGWWNAPLTVDGARAYYTAYYYDAPVKDEYYWVTGYIVGCVATTETVFTATDQTVQFDPSFTTDNNMLIATTPDCTDYEQCVAVQLPSGDVRNSLGLASNASNKGKLVTLYGYIDKYLGLAGLRSVTMFNWGDQGIDNGEFKTPTTDFKLASEITSGRAYAFGAPVAEGRVEQVMLAQPLASESGFLQICEKSDVGGTITALAKYGFLLTETTEGSGQYYMNDYRGQFIYIGKYGSGYSNRPSASPLFVDGDKAYIWQFTKQDDGWLIKNVGAGSTLMYDPEYSSYGCYTDLSKYIAPRLYEMAIDPLTQPDFTGEIEPNIGDGTGEGTKESPYDVTAAVAMVANSTIPMKELYFTGTISAITEVSTQFGNATYDITTGNDVATVYRGKHFNGEKFTSEDQIKVGDVVVVYGTLISFSGKAEISNSQLVKINDEEAPEQPGGGDQPGGGGDDQPSGDVIYQGLLPDAAEIDWTFDNVAMDPGLSYVWQWKEYNGSHYLNGSAYLGGALPAVAYAYTTVDLSGYASATLKFDHAAKFQTTCKELCKVAIREQGTADWTILNIPTWPNAGSWTFASSGLIDLSAFAGKKVDLGLKYESTAAGADTWEIKNFIVNAAK
ncbi:MAG: hypothetical protein J6R27_00060 [Muribaculaceae bacterium]|nr:hypothetical protein [Muribaculaceae bacterium]